MALVLPLSKINSAIKTVTDAFCTTDVVYKTMSSAKFQRFGESGGASWVSHTVKALVDYNGDILNRTNQGSMSVQDVTLLVNSLEFKNIGLYVNGVLSLNESKDVFIVNGKQYKVLSAKPDGSFETQNLLIIIRGELITPQTK